MRKRYKQIRPKVNTEWSHDAIMKLINAVEERPTLWDISSPKYKMPKTPAWQEIAEHIGERTADECKAKWSNLRVTFKTNLNKKQKSGSAFGGSIVWRYFNTMMFLKGNESSQTNESHSQPCRDSISSATESKPTLPKRAKTVLPPPQILATQSLSSNSDVFKEVAVKAIRVMAENTDAKDQFNAFGAYIAAELRSLPLKKGILAKRKLACALIDIMDEAENSIE